MNSKAGIAQYLVDSLDISLTEDQLGFYRSIVDQWLLYVADDDPVFEFFWILYSLGPIKITPHKHTLRKGGYQIIFRFIEYDSPYIMNNKVIYSTMNGQIYTNVAAPKLAIRSDGRSHGFTTKRFEMVFDCGEFFNEEDRYRQLRVSKETAIRLIRERGFYAKRMCYEKAGTKDGEQAD